MCIIFYCVAYIMLIGFFLIEIFSRRGSRDMSQTKSDRNSTPLISAVMGVMLILLVLTPVLNYLNLWSFNSITINSIGLTLGIGGLIVRYLALTTLGKFYTRTLHKTINHRLITHGIYKKIRHPGYLADILIFFGIGLTLGNFIPTAFVIVAFVPMYTYRIRVEEKMLIQIFGQKYRDYQKTSRKLIPFIF